VRVSSQDGAMGRVFVEALVTNVLKNPARFVVALPLAAHHDQPDHELVVKRADIRLLLPPWWDELEEEDGPAVAHVHAGPEAVQAPPPGGPPAGGPPPALGMQDANAYYRSVTTSPLHSHPNANPNAVGVQVPGAGAVLSNGDAEDMRRRPYEDFGESDDELRSVDIHFSTDAGP